MDRHERTQGIESCDTGFSRRQKSPSNRASELNRREFTALLASSLLARPDIAQGASVPKSGTRPKNVLLIMSDQHRPEALGINGNTPARTPNLDALARSGTRFDHAYCTSPACVPSRASLFTGLWAHNHGAYNNELPWPYEHKTLAHYFGSAGYITGAIGKMHFVDAQTHGFDYRLDFDDWLQYLGPKEKLFADEIGNFPNGASGIPQIENVWRDSGDPWTGNVVDDGRMGWTPVGGLSQLEERDHFESYVSRESIWFLKNYASHRPFFLVASFLKPHEPFFPAYRFYNMFSADKMKIPDTWNKVNLSMVPSEIRETIQNDFHTPELINNPENVKKHTALYYSCLAQMDDNVGQILSALREMGLEEDTIVLYTSDHGEMLGEHGLWQKMVFYEPSVGVPLIVRVPGMTQPGEKSQTPVSLVSVVPTLLDLCGIQVSSGLDGEPFTADLQEPRRTRDTTVYSEFALHGPTAKAMIRTGDYKYIAYSHDLPDQMYNLRDDPQEMNNLAIQPQSASRAKELKSRLFAWHKPA